MTPLRRVWRVEDATGHGPSGHRGWNPIRIRYEDNPWRMPTPECDRLRRLKVSVWGNLFAFPDVKTLTRWLGPTALIEFDRAGFVCSVYGVAWEHHTLYENQVIYDPKHAVLIRRLRLTELPTELEVVRLRQMAA